MFWFKNGQTSICLRVLLLDASIGGKAGLTGLTFASSGLRIATIGDTEGVSTAYTGANIQTITNLGTYLAPSAGKCRFREFDAVNHPGLYEIQLADARFAIVGSKTLGITVQAPGAVQADVLVPLTVLDPYNPLALLRQQMIESYAPKGVAPTFEQIVLLVQQFLGESSLAGPQITVRKLDGVTSIATFSIDYSSGPQGTISRTS